MDKEVIIKFSGLKEGSYSFDFELGNTFFAKFENSEFSNAEVSITVDLEKQSTLLKFDVFVAGDLRVNCDRCGEEFVLGIDGNDTIYAKITSEKFEGDDEIIFISPQDFQVDLSQQVYETVALTIPYRKIHPNNGCNAEIVRQLEQNSSANETNTDPRWDKLLQMKNKFTEN